MEWYVVNIENCRPSSIEITLKEMSKIDHHPNKIKGNSSWIAIDAALCWK